MKFDLKIETWKEPECDKEYQSIEFDLDDRFTKNKIGERVRFYKERVSISYGKTGFWRIGTIKRVYSRMNTRFGHYSELYDIEYTIRNIKRISYGHFGPLEAVHESLI